MLKVLHGPVNVGNQPWVLSRYERQLGVRSDLVVNYNTWLGYNYDRCLSKLADKSPGSLMRRTWFGMTAPLRYNVLHYYFGLSFLAWNDLGARRWHWFRDLQFAKLLGRRVFMTLQGCDVRLSRESSERNEVTACNIGECKAAAACRSDYDANRRKFIRDIIPHLDRVFVLNPELTQFVPTAEFLPYASVDVRGFEPALPRPEGPIRILHAPSDPGIKGSRYVIEAVEALKTRYPIEFILVQNLPHAEAVRRYQEADLVIDQALCGWYGGLAVEVMSMGKPVACYMREHDFGCLPADMRKQLPIIQIRPDSLASDLEKVIVARRQLAEIGRRSRQYVERWHDPAKIAAAMVRLYKNPKEELAI